ncbi:MAG: Holliday junction resolvase RuvX [Dongiaceae bacterium]
MPVVAPEDLKRRLGRGERLLGLDLGEKTIGLALSDPGLMVASPLSTLRRAKFTADATALERLAAERRVGGLVLGLPVNMDGSEGPRCQSVRQFAANLLARGDRLITLWDERLSTVAVTRAMLEADLTRRRRGEIVDQLAAAYILQGLLDRLARLGDDRPAPPA